MIDHATYPRLEQIVITSRSWLLRWGIFAVFGLLFLVLVGGSAIPYHKSYKTKIKISSLEPIVFVKAESAGYLMPLNIQFPVEIDKNEILGHISAEAEYESVIALDLELMADSLSLKSFSGLSTHFLASPDLSIELIKDYSDFLNAYAMFIRLKDSANINLIDAQLSGQFAGNLNNLKTKSKELGISKNADSNAVGIIKRYRSLYEKGIISRQELEEREKEYYESIERTQQIQSEIDLLKKDLNFNQTERNKTKWQYEDALKNAFFNLKLSKEKLQSAVNAWKLKNILVSPVSGKVSLYELDSKMRSVDFGDTLFTVIPKNNDKLIGNIKIAPKYLSGVKKGQHVIVELDNYPETEWGNLKGKIETVSNTLNYSGHNGFLATVGLSSNITSYGKNILITPDMSGTATVVLEETSVLDRLFYQIKFLFKLIE